jgi:transposase
VSPDPESLPEHVAALRTLLVAQTAEVAAQKRRLAEMAAERAAQQAELLAARAGLIEQRFEIEALRARLARALRVAFGRSSEKLRTQVEQLELTLTDIDELLGETAPDDNAAVAASPTPPSTADKPVRRPLPAGLPRDVVAHAAPCACPACGGALRPLGEDITEVLDYVPGSFRVTRHVRPKLSCRACETIAQAPAPNLPVLRGRAGPGLLAHVLVAKYCDHLPLHRQAEIYAREDVELSRSTLADMVGQMARLVRPLVDALARHVMAGERVHADDTVVPVLEPGLGRTRTARLWTYVRDDRPFGGPAAPAVLYRYSPDRKGEHPRTHLKDFRGILQADGYAGFAGLYAAGGVVEAACMAHARRKFWDVHEATRSPLAREALDRIGALYRIEETIRGRPPDQRLQARREHTAPLMAELHNWLETTRGRVPGRSELAGAIRYALSRWAALSLTLADGRACIDNSAAERAIRPIALGRRNWTFAGSDAGGERAATIYSVIETAKINGLDPEHYLRRVISTIADHPVNRVAELLPWSLSGTRLRLDQRLAA